MPRAKIGSSTKIGVIWQKSDFWAKNQDFGPKKKCSLLAGHHVLATTDGLNGKVIDTYLLYIFHLYFAQASKFPPRADVEKEGEQDGRGAADEAP